MMSKLMEGSGYMFHSVKSSAKEWTLGCVNSHPARRGSQEAGFTQPREHSLPEPCIWKPKVNNCSTGFEQEMHNEYHLFGIGTHVAMESRRRRREGKESARPELRVCLQGEKKKVCPKGCCCLSSPFSTSTGG